MSHPNDHVPSGHDPGRSWNPSTGYPAQQGPNLPAPYPQQHQQPYPQYPQQGPYPPNPYPQQNQQPYGQMMVAPKSPGVAVIASFFIPGLGSMISGRGGIGALILCLYVISWFLTIVIIGIVGVIAFWIWGMIQGYADAVAWNRSHGIIS